MKAGPTTFEEHSGNMAESITTERLVLREIRESDFHAVHAYASDPEVARYMNWGPNSECETREFIARALRQQRDSPGTGHTFAICQLDSGLVGGCGISITDELSRQGFIGYLLHRAHWGKGYATESAQALLSFGFGKLGLHRIWTDCDTENTASAHVLEKLGMRKEGTLVECKLKNGSWRSCHLYALLSSEAQDAR
jgi:[ribosomal protein S5]-alanine N-acetyltransferase